MFAAWLATNTPLATSKLYDGGNDTSYDATQLILESTNAARAVVHEMSLGGIWDQQLEVWWTPVMANGALTYQATTNVNMEANQ